MRIAVVKAAYDEDCGVWHVEHSDVDGLHVEGQTLRASATTSGLRFLICSMAKAPARSMSNSSTTPQCAPASPRDGLRQGGPRQIERGRLRFLRRGKRDHDIWATRDGKRIVVPVRAKSRHTTKRYSEGRWRLRQRLPRQVKRADDEHSLAGGLFGTDRRRLTLLLIALFRKVWAYSLASVLIANALSAIICVMLARFGYDDLKIALNYLIPQVIIFAITVLQWRGRRKAAA